MTLLLSLFKITFIVMVVIDWLDIPTDWFNSVASFILKKQTYYRVIKPFSCGLCMTFWVCLIYVAVKGLLCFDTFFYCICFAVVEPFLYLLFCKIETFIRMILQ